MATQTFENRVDQFFRNEYKKLVRYVEKNMRQRYGSLSSEDIVQDVALGLLDKLNIDVQIENLAGYIYKSLRNKMIDEQRKSKPHVSIENIINTPNEYVNNHLIVEEVDETLIREHIEPEALHQAINNLQADDKYIINVTHFEGKGYKQLSEEMKTPIGTLLSRKHRAQQKLFKILNDNYIN